MVSTELMDLVYKVLLRDGGDRPLNAAERIEYNLPKRLRDCSDQAIMQVMQVKRITVTQFLHLMELTVADKDKQAHIWGFKDQADMFAQAKALQEKMATEVVERKQGGWSQDQ